MAYNKEAKHIRKIFHDNIDEAIAMYKSGVSMVNIAKHYKVDRDYVSNVFVDIGVRQKGESKYSLNETYFDQIDNPNKAYFFGLLLADGCNHIVTSKGQRRYHVTISLQEEDKYILQALCKEIELNRPLRKVIHDDAVICGKFVRAENFKNSYVVDVYNKHMSLALDRLGMVENKTWNLKFPNISFDLLPHMVRGYFDGNGSIYKYMLSTNGCVRFGWKIISTKMFCYKLQRILFDLFKMHLTVSMSDPKNNDITAVISTTKPINIIKLYEWMYNDAEMYLTRKRCRFLEYFNINDSLLV